MFSDKFTAWAEEKVMEQIMDSIEIVLETFQWAYPNRGDNRGEIHVDREDRKLHLTVWTLDNDNPDQEELNPLDVRKDITVEENAQDQIRSLIHDYLCHEADEQMWFDNERPYYPHDS